MPISEAALEGIQEFGHQWRFKVGGFRHLGDAMCSVGASCTQQQAESIVFELRRAVKSVQRLLERRPDLKTMSLEETVDVLGDISVTELMSEGLVDLEGWLSDLYDWADYNRVLLD